MPLPFDNRRVLYPTDTRRQRGQTAIIALLVLLLLSFVGALFITIVAGNLRTTGRAHRTLDADYYAEAGIRYADDQLTNSIEGADWRPALQFQLDPTALTQVVGPAGSRAQAWYAVAKNTLGVIPANDPDKAFLEEGFSSYNTESGRFLLRVTYDPARQSNSADPTARYIKIESIGRDGVVDASDPTTFINQPPVQLAATRVAYKPIGITDYARFETNLNQRADVINLGVPSAYQAPISSANYTPLAGIVTPNVYDFNLSGGAGGGGTPNTNDPILPYPVITTYGSSNAYIYNNTTGAIFANNGSTPPSGFASLAGGGSIRANGTLRLYGVTETYLNRPAAGAPLMGVFDDIEVSGNLLLDNYDPIASLDNTQSDNTGSMPTGQSAALILNPTPGTTPPLADYVAPSNGLDTATGTGTAFSTHDGSVRDGDNGSGSSDANGYPRSIARLDPPLIDTVNSATSLTRYQDITENSSARMYPGTSGSVDADIQASDLNAGQDGWGRAIYVDNTSDIQRDSSALVGGHTLEDEWLHPDDSASSSLNAKSGWQGPFYNPPGVDLTFGLQEENIDGSAYSFYGVRLTRSDVDSNGNPVLWKNEDGTQGTSPTMIVSYHDLYASNDPDNMSANTVNPNNDVVIYCEGNVRIKPSIISAGLNEQQPSSNGAQRLYPSSSSAAPYEDDTLPRHITIVTNGTAYIEGSILKGNPDSSMTIMAKNYVCVNTTQLYAGAVTDEDPQSTQPPNVSVADNTLLDFGAQNNVLVLDFLNPFGDNNGYADAFGSGAGGDAPGNLSLYVSGGPSSPGVTAADFDFVDPATGLSLNTQQYATPQPFDYPFITALFDTTGGVASVVNGAPIVNNPAVENSSATSLQHITFDLSSDTLLESVAPNYPLELWTRLDQKQQVAIGPGVNVATQDYMQERAAILPRDVLIQAVLYAQDKSFFVIPGPWFNTDTGDDLGSYSVEVQKGYPPPAARAGIDAGNENQARFPFYGQPIDLRIIVQGAVSENEPADISAQGDWMTKWGWIPAYHGSNFSEPSGHTQTTQIGGPLTGLTLVYDPEAGYPYDPTGAGMEIPGSSQYYLRMDTYGRPLPFTPDLPVSTGLLYAGQGDPQAL